MRAVRAADVDFLVDMTMEAVNWDPRRRLTRIEVAADPALAHYWTGWGRPGDLGVIGVDPYDEPIGAAWLRRFPADDPGYGFVGEDVPELTVAVVPLRRGRGVGRALLDELFARAARTGVRRVSLSVEQGNRAADLYASLGFRDVTAHAAATARTLLLNLPDTAR